LAAPHATDDDAGAGAVAFRVIAPRDRFATACVDSVLPQPLAEIGRVPHRDRFSSGSRSVRRRRARLPGPRGGHVRASPTSSSDSRA